jgi:hypothetical protein
MQLRSTKPPLYCDFDRCFGYSALSCEHFHRSQLKPGKLCSLTKRPVLRLPIQDVFATAIPLPPIS